MQLSFFYTRLDLLVLLSWHYSTRTRLGHSLQLLNLPYSLRFLHLFDSTSLVR